MSALAPLICASGEGSERPRNWKAATTACSSQACHQLISCAASGEGFERIPYVSISAAAKARATRSFVHVKTRNSAAHTSQSARPCHSAPPAKRAVAAKACTSMCRSSSRSRHAAEVRPPTRKRKSDAASVRVTSSTAGGGAARAPSADASSSPVHSSAMAALQFGAGSQETR